MYHPSSFPFLFFLFLSRAMAFLTQPMPSRRHRRRIPYTARRQKEEEEEKRGAIIYKLQKERGLGFHIGIFFGLLLFMPKDFVRCCFLSSNIFPICLVNDSRAIYRRWRKEQEIRRLQPYLTSSPTLKYVIYISYTTKKRN